MASDQDTKPARSWLAIRMFGRDLPWYWTLIILATLIVTMHLMVKLQTKDATHQFLEGFAWLGKGSFRNSDYAFDGRVESTDLSIVADADGSAGAIRIPRVSVQTPGFFWLLRTQMPSLNLFKSIFGKKAKLEQDSGDQYPPTYQLRILFEAVDWGDIGMETVLPDVGWVGPYSGAAFEAAGCRQDWWWHRGEFAKNFKLAEPAGDINLVFRVEGDQILTQSLEFGTAETAHAIIERRFQLPAPEEFLDTPSDAWRTLDVRWSFRDHGFNKARNRFCAEQAHISEAEFIDRHVAAVERIMAAKGLLFPRTMWLAYRRYAEGGKELTWQSDFGEGIALEDFRDKRGAAMFTALNASVRVEGFPRVPYRPEMIPPQPLPEDGEYPSLFALLQSERGAAIPALDASLAPVAASPSDPASGLSEALADPLVAATSPPAVTEIAHPVAPRPLDAPTSMSATGATTVAATATPTAVSVATPAVAPLPEALLPPPSGSELKSSELGKYIGMYVRVELSSGRSYIGAVAKNDVNAVTLKVRMRSGNASLMLPHKQIRRVTRQ